MPRVKEPVNLLVAKGQTHLTKEEIAARAASEIKAPADKITAPKYLTKTQREKFNDIARQLIAIEIMSNLDVDILAMYIQSHDKYLKYNRMVNRVLSQTGAADIIKMADNAELLADYETLRDKAIKQCRSCASDLGLTITSRCRLVVPRAVAAQPENSILKRFG